MEYGSVGHCSVNVENDDRGHIAFEIGCLHGRQVESSRGCWLQGVLILAIWHFAFQFVCSFRHFDKKFLLSAPVTWSCSMSAETSHRTRCRYESGPENAMVELPFANHESTIEGGNHLNLNMLVMIIAILLYLMVIYNLDVLSLQAESWCRNRV